MSPHTQRDSCTRCGKKHLGEVVMLELDSYSGLYHADGVPPARSQGWFPFGRKCAKTLLSQGRHQATIRRAAAPPVEG